MGWMARMGGEFLRRGGGVEGYILRLFPAYLGFSFLFSMPGRKLRRRFKNCED